MAFSEEELDLLEGARLHRMPVRRSTDGIAGRVMSVIKDPFSIPGADGDRQFRDPKRFVLDPVNPGPGVRQHKGHHVELELASGERRIFDTGPFEVVLEEEAGAS